MTLNESAPESLVGSARSALVWAAGSAILRDTIQFAAMILLVRLLTPSDYGRFAIAQTIVVLISVLSSKSFVMHSLQMRDRDSVPWQSHFTASVVTNTVVSIITLFSAAALGLIPKFAGSSGPLAVLSLLPLIDIGVQFATARLKAAHEWGRFSRLTVIGTALGLGSSIMIALLGGGVWSLVATILLPGIPFNIDLFVRQKWRADGSWDRRSFAPVIDFAATRIGGAVFLAGRNTTEQAVIGAHYDLATLGLFNRAIGLSTLIAGRIGLEVVGALFPVLTRAEEASPRFQRLAGLLLQSVAWTTIPAGAFLIIAGGDLVDLLYGPHWRAVKPFVPAAAAFTACTGITATAYSLLLANNKARACMGIDLASAATAVALVFWLIPKGPTVYLTGLTILSLGALVVTCVILKETGGMRYASLAHALWPALIAALAACLVLEAGTLLGSSVLPLLMRLVGQAAVFSVTYLLVLRLFFGTRLGQLLEVAPAGSTLARFLRLKLV
jgi:O-antigen/teichoic acid export membrane protein